MQFKMEKWILMTLSRHDGDGNDRNKGDINCLEQYYNNIMEFLANNKRGNEPIHARKGRLAPIALSKLKKVELKIKEGWSPKTNELPKVTTLDSSELTQYMSCGGIKLNCRLNLSVEKKRKKDSVPEGKTSSIIRIE